MIKKFENFDFEENWEEFEKDNSPESDFYKYFYQEEPEPNINRNNIIKPLENYTDEEKINKFNQLYNYALDDFNDHVEHGGDINYDNQQHLWEMVMELLAIDKRRFWRFFNNMGN